MLEVTLIQGRESDMKIMTLLGSSRKDGNTAYLSNKALEGIDHKEIFLLEKKLNPIVDQRHDAGGFDMVNDDYEELFFDFLQYDTYFFVTPVYWFGVSGQMKIFFDRWSQYMKDERIDFWEAFRGKKAYVIVTGENPHPKTAALPLILQFNAIFEYLNMEFVDYVIGKANKPGDIQSDAYALEKMKLWNQQLKADSSELTIR